MGGQRRGEGEAKEEGREGEIKEKRKGGGRTSLWDWEWVSPAEGAQEARHKRKYQAWK
jgi:hypothetical protein